ncbi:hypothetical protein ACFXPA_33325 [Amycolatopsis sp. NPDC059090]|uniref:hypothetical protein n=1 Tax=unclassified Amycolatopsis TaxID=2618356 RepID=UPI00366B5297
MAVVGTAAALAACGSAPPATAPASSPASTPSSSASASESDPPPAPVKADPKYLPSWMRDAAENPADAVAQDFASAAMTRLESDLVHDGLSSLQELPDFPQRAVRQCTALNARLPDPDGEAVRSFSTPRHPVNRAEGARINAAIRRDCA